MAFFKAATLGCLFCLAGTVLLLLATISSPIVKSIYFLSANLSGNGTGATSGISASTGEIRLGTFGYCVQSRCTGVKLGYDLSDDALLDAANQFANISNSLIRGLSYVLILHPIAAGLGLIATLFGLFAHRRELAFTLTLVATWFGSLACTFALLAFVFDMVAFTIAKNRINDASSSSDSVQVEGAAAYGIAIWLTLAGFLCFAFSGCGFAAGRRLAKARQRDRMASEALKPKVDDSMAYDARNAAKYAEKRRTASQKEEDLPYFSEHETVPLRAYNDRETTEFGNQAANGHYQQATSSTTGYDRAAIDGVGMGYGRRTPHQYNDSQSQVYQSTPGDSNSSFRHSRVGSQPEPFQSMYGVSSTPPPQVPSPAQRPDALQAGSPQYPQRVSAMPVDVPQPGLLAPHHQDSYSSNYYTPSEQQPLRDHRLPSATSMYSQAEDQHYAQQAYDPPPMPVSSAAGGYYAQSHAPTYRTDDPQESFNYFSQSGNYAAQPVHQYDAGQRYSQTGPLAADNYAYTSDQPQQQSRERSQSPVNYRASRGGPTTY